MTNNGQATLAIDQGTTSTRFIRIDEYAKSELVFAAEHEQHYPHKGWVEHSPHELLKTISHGLALARNISAVGLANQGESCLAWHADTLDPISPIIVWQDARTQDIIEQLHNDGVVDEVRVRAGLPLDPYFSASKLGWIMRELPEARRLHKQGKLRLGTTDAFFLAHLTGVCATDITTASRTSLMNLQTGLWDEELCTLFGVPIDALPPICATEHEFGAVATADGAVPLTASLVDQQASLFGHGCRHSGDVKFTFGTGAFALILTCETLHASPEHGLLPTVAWQRAGAAPEYALDGGVYCASSAINWARSLGLFSEFNQINEFPGVSALERDLVFVPALTGLACPHWDRTAAGLWIGLTLDTTSEDMVRAILEGVALRAGEVLRVMSTYGRERNTLSIDGGMSRNPYFCQYLANTTGCDILLRQNPELTALGTAMMASGDKIVGAEDTVKRIQPMADYSNHAVVFEQAIARSIGWNQP